MKTYRFLVPALGLILAATAVGQVAKLSSHRAFTKASTNLLSLRSAPLPLPKEGRARIVESYGKLPLSFETNEGQSDSQVKFLSRGSSYTLFLTSNEAVLVLRGRERTKGRFEQLPLEPKPAECKNESAVLRMKLVGANRAPEVAGMDELPGKSNYFIGNDPTKWRTNVPNYARVRYRNVYPGVDLVYYGSERQLEHDFVVAPGADPSRIQLAIRGVQLLWVGKDGDLRMSTQSGEVRLHKPAIYQEVEGKKHAVEGHYILKGKRRVGFALAAYDASQPLVIDPVLVYSTYLGGNGIDSGFGIAVDITGHSYVTGFTTSSSFPTTPGAFQATFGGGFVNAFVTKLNPTGSGLVYSTYLGGSGSDNGIGIAVDASRSAYVTGVTSSTNFPTTAGAFQTTLSGSEDAFVTKLNPTGSALVYSTYLGGGGSEQGSGIAVDASGNAFVTGLTASTDFPTTGGAFQTTFGGVEDAFVTKLNPTGSTLLYSTYLGGSGLDEGAGVAVDGSGSAYVTGPTASTDFPTAPGAFQGSLSGSEDAFVTKLNPAGSGLVYSTYLGGSSDEFGFSIAVDALGNAYVSGITASTDFPTTPGAFQTTFGGIEDAFVTKLNPAGSAPIYSTYLGGSSLEFGPRIAVDASGNAFVTGLTASTDFPTTPGAFQTTFGGIEDAFVTKFNPAGSALLYSTYLGGGNRDGGDGIAVDTLGNVYATGFTESTNFPTRPGAFQTSLGGFSNAFVARISPSPQDLIAALVGQVQALVDAGVLNQGQGNSLITKLTQVLSSLAKGDTQAACAQLQAFINEVSSLISNGVLTPAQGQPLIDAATNIEVVISC